MYLDNRIAREADLLGHANGTEKANSRKELKQTTKLEDIELCAGIHTMECTLDGIAPEDAAAAQGVTVLPMNGRLHINVNKYARETGKCREHYIPEFSDFSTAFHALVDETGASGYEIHRADFRIDSTVNEWRDMLKWNYALMYAMQAAAGLGGDIRRWDTYGTTIELYNGNGSALSCYDRAGKLGNTAPTKARYEIRERMEQPMQDVSALGSVMQRRVYIISKCAEYFSQIQESAETDIRRDIAAVAGEWDALGLKIERSKLFLIQKERIFTAAQAVRVGAALGLDKRTVYRYSARGDKRLQAEYLTGNMLHEYAGKAAAAMGAFISR